MPLVLLLLLATAGCITERRMERAVARTDLGVAYLQEGSPEKAIETLEQAHRLDPRNWRALNALALAYVSKGRQDLARRAFERAARINPGEAEVLINYGSFLVRNGEVDEGIAAFEEALRDLDYRNPALVQSNLAYAYHQAKRYDDGIGMAREAVRRVPDLCQAWFHLGLNHEGKGEVEAAMDAYKTLWRTCPADSTGARLRMGCLMVAGGDREGGVATLQGVVAEAPNTVFADEARACLRGAGL